MESMYGSGTNASLYLALAYGIGILSLFGYGFWAILDRQRLMRLKTALERQESKPDG